jgi:hypothetical protein
MQKLHKALPVLLLPLGAVSLVLAASATGRTSDQVRRKRVPSPVTALAVDGNRVAFGTGSRAGHAGGEVFVWNLGTGRTTKVSGRRTGEWPYSDSGGLSEVVLAGSRVAWILRIGANSSSSDLLFASSLTRPRERQVASVQRTAADCGSMGPHCAGKWIGGLVGAGERILANRYTTGGGGKGKVAGVHHAVTSGGLYALAGTALQPLASGTTTVEAAYGDRGRVAVLRPNGSVGLYTSAGKRLLSVTPTPRAAEVALNGRNLLVLEYGGTLALYDSSTGSLRKTLRTRGDAKLDQNLGVQGNVAIYTTGVGFGPGDFSRSTLHAVNLGSGKDRVVGRFGNSFVDVIGLARISRAGVVYATSRVEDNGKLVFLPWARVAAAVG